MEWSGVELVSIIFTTPEVGDIFRGRRPRKISSTEGVINLVFHKLKGAIIILFYTTLT